MATFGVLISNRSFFPDHLVLTARQQLLACLGQWGHKVITLSPEDTNMGETMTYAEAEKCAALFKAHADEIDGVIIMGKLSREYTGMLAEIGVPFVFQGGQVFEDGGFAVFVNQFDQFILFIGIQVRVFDFVRHLDTPFRVHADTVPE